MDFVLIDDDPINLFLTKELLQIEGVTGKIIDFSNPEKALEFLKNQIANGQVPGVILLDLNMPKISGWDLLENLEPYNNLLEAKKCLIYLLTSSLDPRDIKRVSEYPQVKEFIQKPLDSNKIMKIQANMRGIY